MKSVDIVVPVYNATDVIDRLLESLHAQSVTADIELRTFIVDDGSTDKRAVAALNALSSAITLIRHERNRGRAAARNSGATAGQGDILLFLDADCYIHGVEFVMHHARTIESGAHVSAGVCLTEGKSFLAALEADVNRRRASGPAWAALTSANFAISRKVFEDCGGFDERYRCYGFEDRDFAARLTERGYAITFNPEAVVCHNDVPTAGALLERMEEAGECSSGLFLQDHPVFYAQLSYSHVDFRTCSHHGRVLYALGLTMRPILRAIVARVLHSGSSAFALKAFAFRVATGLAYMRGTRRAWISERRISVR